MYNFQRLETGTEYLNKCLKIFKIEEKRYLKRSEKRKDLKRHLMYDIMNPYKEKTNPERNKRCHLRENADFHT